MKCSYCSREIEPGTGTMYVLKTGAIRYYCSNRCFKLDMMHRKSLARRAEKEASKASKQVAEQQSQAQAKA